jgi:two-component system chemotaxis response regulator CheB
MPKHQPHHDLIVIGGSAGGLDALLPLVRGLPPDLPAAVCVVLHRAPNFPSLLPDILSGANRLTVVAAEDGMPLRVGTIHVAVSDFHLLIERGENNGDGRLRLVRGPKENRARPAVDALFRSAALAFGPRVIGVILSGALDDGTVGLWTVRDRGGLAVIQDPMDAQVPSMPRSALVEAGADHVVPAVQLGPLLGRLARLPVYLESAALIDEEGAVDRVSDLRAADLEREVAIGALDDEAHERPERYGAPSRFACPECGGVLWNTGQGMGPMHFRCETGHAYAPGTLAELQSEAVEEALWAALRALEDRAELARQRALRADERGLNEVKRKFETQLDATHEHAGVVRALLRLDGRTGVDAEATAVSTHDASARDAPGAPEPEAEPERPIEPPETPNGQQAAANATRRRGGERRSRP